jgi:hypothetical protein
MERPEKTQTPKGAHVPTILRAGQVPTGYARKIRNKEQIYVIRAKCAFLTTENNSLRSVIRLRSTSYSRINSKVASEETLQTPLKHLRKAFNE